MDPNTGLMLATFIYAGATGALAWVTGRGMSQSTKDARQNNRDTLDASEAALTRQLIASREATDRQIEASTKVGREQALLSSISLNRQGWITQLRDEVASFVAENALTRNIGERITERDTQIAEKRRIYAARRKHFHKVQLLINPKEEPSLELLNLMREGLSGTLSLELEDEIVAKAQAILKTEWDRVRAGE